MKNMVVCFQLFLSFICSVVFAQTPEQLRLISQETRPSVELIMSNAVYLTPFGAAIDQAKILTFKAALPSVIARLEKAFPGGTYAFLGRDTDTIADLVEGFYLSVGQRGRVVRVPLSTPSFDNNPDAAMITQFMQQVGLSEPGKKPAAPMVLIDVSKYATSSQSRKITRAVIEEYSNVGLRMHDIPNWLNIAVFPLQGIAVPQIDPLNLSVSQVANMLNRQAQEVSHNGFSQVVVIGEAQLGYGSEWNNKYGPMERHGGRVVSNPMSYFDIATKTRVFAQMIETFRQVLEPNFLQQTVNFVASHGISFSRQPRVTMVQQPAAQPTGVELDNAFKRVIERDLLSLPQLPLEREYKKRVVHGRKYSLTENGEAVLDSLLDGKAVQSPNYLLFSFNALVSLFKAEKIGSREFRRIFIQVLSQKKIEDSVVSRILNFAGSIEPLDFMLDRPREREKYSALPGLAGDNYRQLTQNGSRPVLACKKIFK
jgi:hypothetical protein